MKFYQNMLNETVELLEGEQLKYRDSILIGDNAAGKSEALKRLIEESERVLYFIDAVNRCFDVKAVKPLGEEVAYKEEIVQTRMREDNFNLKDTWAYYGTATECIELIYLQFEEQLQVLLRECVGVGFTIYFPETQEVKYDSGDIGRLSSGYQAVIRILLELIYFQKVNSVNAGERRPLVVVDEIDEYLSPGNAIKLYRCIKRNFSDMDLILTTHSAEIIATATDSNILIMHEQNVEVLDANDFPTIDDAMNVFKNIFDICAKDHEDTEYESLLRKLFNNRIAGIWGENEIESYETILEEKLTTAQKLLYRQIGEW